MNEELVSRVLKSKGGREVCPDTVRRIVSECEGRYKKPKDLEKAVREKLHGITGAFMTETETKRAQEALRTGDLETALMQHSSTRERMPIDRMDALYEKIFSITGRPDSLLDLACGLNPVYLAARYDFPVTGVDISGSCVRLINDSVDPQRVHAVCGDLLETEKLPKESYHTTLLFKVLPLLERQRSGASREVFENINSRHFVVSFPLRTLGGKNVGMREHYSEWMDSHMPEGMKCIDRFTFDERELYYVLTFQ